MKPVHEHNEEAEAEVAAGPRLALRAPGQPDKVVRVGPVSVGGGPFVVMAGPCAVESASQLETTAASVATSGAHVLRGGVYKPRTSPYAFQGLGETGLNMLRDAGARHGLPIVAEVMSEEQVRRMATDVDLLQVGARNMQNFSLLKAVSAVRKPVLLKRGFANTVGEWLLAAEYILDGGNPDVILCERGIRTFDNAVRFTLDLSAVALVKERSALPVLVDPSHATGNRSLVTPMALAAAAAGADGILVEVHPDPEHALCDGPQALTPEMFATLMRRLNALMPALGRRMAPSVRGDAP
ncbi:MAG: 3-deoxy-7-phosphoheptulonate synthase [Myxococcota bacterium]